MEQKYQESVSEKGNIVPEGDEVQTEEMQNRIDFMGNLRENIVKESDIEIVGDLSVYIQSD